MPRVSRRTGLMITISFVGVIALAIFLNSAGLFRLNSVGILGLEGTFRSAMHNANQPEQWTVERMQLLEQLSQLQGLSDENARLREALDFAAKKKYAYTLANVISRDPFSPSLVFIDAGSVAGAAVGQPVVVGSGTLIGKIVRVGAMNSTVELLSGESSRVAVKAMDEASTSGIVRGILGTSARLEYIRDVNALSVGTIIVTSGLEPSVPQGLLVGTVQKITDDPDQLFSYADVLPAADLSRLSIVTILKGI